MFFFEKKEPKNFCSFGAALVSKTKPKGIKVFLLLFVHKKKRFFSLRIMKHATPEALIGLAGLLESIRLRDGLREKKTGIFYRSGQSFLHFHEDPAGMFADLRNPDGWDRYKVDTPGKQAALLAALDAALGR